jgi:hypothetical protein
MWQFRFAHPRSQSKHLTGLLQDLGASLRGCDYDNQRVSYSTSPKEKAVANENITVSDMFRRALEMRREKPSGSYKEIKDALVKQFSGGPLPSLHNLTIPEQDDKAPEEDWTAGLPLVRRGIQFHDWKEIADGIILSLEQTENYVSQRGPEGTSDKWHDRTKGIEESTTKAVGKWMPEELMALAESHSKK